MSFLFSFFFLSIFFFVCFVIIIFFLLFFFFFSFFFTFLLIIFFYLCIFFPLLFLTFSYFFFFSYLFYFFILIYLVIFSFLYSHCHRSQTSQVMPCWRLPTTLPHAMHRSDILNFHREYSKMYDAERISTTYIPSNRYLKRKKKWTKDN